MKDLVVNEFFKLKRNKYIFISLVLITIPILINVFILSFSPQSYNIGEINKINIVVLALIGSRSLFPLLGMFLISFEYANSGFEIIYTSPISGFKFIGAKIITAVLWMLVLTGISIILVTIVEILFFTEPIVVLDIIKSLKAYGLVVLYTIPFQLLAIYMVFVLRNIVLPMIFLIAFMGIEYVVYVTTDLSRYWVYIPEYIIRGSALSDVRIALFLHGFIGLLAVYFLNRQVARKEFYS